MWSGLWGLLSAQPRPSSPKALLGTRLSAGRPPVASPERKSPSRAHTHSLGEQWDRLQSGLCKGTRPQLGWRRLGAYWVNRDWGTSMQAPAATPEPAFSCEPEGRAPLHLVLQKPSTRPLGARAGPGRKCCSMEGGTILGSVVYDSTTADAARDYNQTHRLKVRVGPAVGPQGEQVGPSVQV